MLADFESHMHGVTSSNYLGNVFMSGGGVRKTITDRRNKGWGKVAHILGILGEVPLGQHKHPIHHRWTDIIRVKYKFFWVNFCSERTVFC